MLFFWEWGQSFEILSKIIKDNWWLPPELSLVNSASKPSMLLIFSSSSAIKLVRLGDKLTILSQICLASSMLPKLIWHLEAIWYVSWRQFLCRVRKLPPLPTGKFWRGDLNWELFNFWKNQLPTPVGGYCRSLIGGHAGMITLTLLGQFHPKVGTFLNFIRPSWK